MRVCSGCGKRWPDSVRFCPIDGATLNTLEPLPKEVEQDSSPKATPLPVSNLEESPTVLTQIDPLADLLGRTLNRTYRIEEQVGQGGMGAVFKAKHLGIGDYVALKVICSEHIQNASVLARFRREAQAARRLAHPNAVAVHDFNSTEEGLFFMVMEYVKGQTVEQYLVDQGIITPERALEILRPVAAALDVAHNLGIIHRDLKPANLMLCRDTAGREQVKVLDFGTARINEDNTAVAVTQKGQIFGTPMYMAPEQVLGEPSEPATDTYALGTILYQMLTGTPPFHSRKSMQIMMSQVHTIPDPPSQRYPALTNRFDRLILKALEKQPELRYSRAGEMLDRLAQLILPVQREIKSTRLEALIIPTPSLVVEDPKALLTGDQKISKVKLAALKEPIFDQFVGRDSELKRLQAEFFKSQEAKANTTFIISNPGMGKTRLIQKFRDWANEQGAMILMGKFFDYGGSVSEPLRLFKNMLIGLVPTGALNSIYLSLFTTDDQSQAGKRAFSESESVEKWQVFDALVGTFHTIAKNRSIVLLLDDLQWADALSLEFIGYLLRNTEGLKFYFVGTARAEEAQSKGHSFREWLVGQTRYTHYEKIELVPFDRKMVNQFLQAIFQFIEINPKEIDGLVSLTGGNPFYLSELIKLLTENGKIVFHNGIWRGSGFDEIRLPDTIINIVRYKIEACSEALRDMLNVAAVIGDEFQFEILEAATETPETELENLLAAGVKATLLEESGTKGDDYRFHTSTIRRVIYDEIPKRQRRRTHARVAAAITKVLRTKLSSFANILAYHYYMAGEWAETVKYSQSALEHAFRKQAMDEVVRYCQYAEEALHQLLENATDQTRKDYQYQIGELKIRRATALMRLGDFKAAEQEAQNMAAAITQLNDQRLQARRYLILIELCYWRSNYLEGMDIGPKGLELAQMVQDQECIRHIMYFLVWCQARVKAPLAPVLTFFQEIVDTCEQAGDTSLQTRTLCGLGEFSHFVGDWRNARRRMAEARDLAHTVNDRFVEAQVLLLWPWILSMEGKNEEAQQLAQEGIKLSLSCGWRNWEGYHYYISGRIYLRSSQPDLVLAEEMLSRSISIMQETHDLTGQLIASTDLAFLAVYTNPCEETLAQLRKCAEVFSQYHETVMKCEVLCAIATTEQRLGHWELAQHTWTKALELALAIPYPDSLWRIYAGLAAYYLKEQQETSTIKYLAQAIEVIDRLKTQLDSDDEIALFMEGKQHIYDQYNRLVNL